jgi:predicted secreted protein
MLLALAVFALFPPGAVLILAATALVTLKLVTLVKWAASIFAALSPFLVGITVAYPGYGSHLASGGTAGTTYVNIGQLKKFDFGGLKADFDDITNMDSPTIFKEYMKTLVDGSDVTFDGVLNPVDVTTQALLTNIATAGSAALFFWKITTTDGSTFVFNAYVASFKFGAEYNKAITFSGSLKVVGAVTATWS